MERSQKQLPRDQIFEIFYYLIAQVKTVGKTIEFLETLENF